MQVDDLRAILEKLYKDAGENLTSEIYRILRQPAEAPSPPADVRNANWTTYIVYPDAFFADSEPGSYFASLKEELPRIKDLGCNAVHILPLFASPGFDMGFDVSDFLTPNERYGKPKELEDLLGFAKQLDLKIILDLILNHVSIEHLWFKKALSGDKPFSSYFITTSLRPTLLERCYAPSVGEYACYQLNNQTFSQRIIFPTQCDPQLPHWEKAGQQDWYYYQKRMGSGLALTHPDLTLPPSGTGRASRPERLDEAASFANDADGANALPGSKAWNTCPARWIPGKTER